MFVCCEVNWHTFLEIVMVTLWKCLLVFRPSVICCRIYNCFITKYKYNHLHKTMKRLWFQWNLKFNFRSTIIQGFYLTEKFPDKLLLICFSQIVRSVNIFIDATCFVSTKSLVIDENLSNMTEMPSSNYFWASKNQPLTGGKSTWNGTVYYITCFSQTKLIGSIY